MVDREEERDRRAIWTSTIVRERDRDVARDRVGGAAERRERRARSGGGRRRSSASRGTRRRCGRSPSRSGAGASKPNSSAARAWRRGCAAARSASTCPRRCCPSKPTASRDELGGLADRGLDARAEVDRLRAVVALGREDEAVDAVVDVEELARRRAVAPEHDLVGPGPRSSSGSAPGSRATSRGRSCRPARRGSPAAGRSRSCRTARGRPARRRAPPSSRRRTARSSPRGSRSRGRPRGTAPA